MGLLSRTAPLGVAASAALVVFSGFGRAAAPEPATSFRNQVLPIFQEHCVMCHAPGGVGYRAISLDLRSYRGLRSGSAAGVAVIPYHPDRSLLMRVLVDDWESKSENALRMPPLGPQLSPAELDAIRRWIKEGAKDN